MLGIMPKKHKPSLHVTNHFGITKLKNYWQKQPQMPHGLSNCVGESMGCIIMWLRFHSIFDFQVGHFKVKYNFEHRTKMDLNFFT